MSQSKLAKSTSKVQPRFLVFEGLDGSGKSTLMAGVIRELQTRTYSFIQSREPGGTPLAEEIRRLILRTEGEYPAPRTEMLLYAASRAQHVAQVLKPALEKGSWILCDRFSASSVAFQAFARGVPRGDVDWLNRYAEQGISPDLCVLLDLTVEESERRRAKRESSGQEADRMEREQREFHERVRQGYLAQAKENPAGWLVLDASLSPATMLEQLIANFEVRGWLA